MIKSISELQKKISLDFGWNKLMPIFNPTMIIISNFRYQFLQSCLIFSQDKRKSLSRFLSCMKQRENLESPELSTGSILWGWPNLRILISRDCLLICIYSHSPMCLKISENNQPNSNGWLLWKDMRL